MCVYGCMSVISEQVLLGAQLKKHFTLTSDLLTVSNGLLQITKQSSFLRRLAMPQQ